MKICLARHGQDEDNAQGILNGHRDSSLTKLGIEQSEKLAQQIKILGLKFDKIYTSPLKRAFQTAEIIAKTQGSEELIILKDLIERDFGVMTGQKVDAIESICARDILKTEHTVYFLSPEGGETFPKLFQRAKQVLKWIKTHPSEGNILLVTHGDLGKMIYAAHYELTWEQGLLQFHFENSELLFLSPDQNHEHLSSRSFQ